jgi:MFS family permease
MEKSKSKVGLRLWLVFVIVGLAGQFAWSIENMYLNSYIAYLNFTAPAIEKFDYSLIIAITTALSAITATLTTLFMGGLTDKIKRRKPFIAVGYIVWGLATASFGLLNVGSSTSLIPIQMAAVTAAIMVIVIDCIMTFFGSTANDAAFNSYVTQNTKDSNRAKVEGVLSILPLISMLVIFVGLNGLTTKDGGYKWDLFFYIIGAIVILVGIVSIFLIPKEDKVEKSNEPYFRLLVEGFKPSTIKTNKKLYLILIAYFIFATATQVFFPYLMIYVEKTCAISNSGSGLLTSFAIVMAVALLGGSLLSVIFGNLADKYGKGKMIIPTLVTYGVGILLMFFGPYISSETGRTVYMSISTLIMILGFVAVPTILNAFVREYIPKGKEGVFMGVRMIFVVLLPMCIGPFIGDAMNGIGGLTYTDDFGIKNNIPSNYGYLIALAILALVVIPLIFIFKNNKKEQIENNGTKE